MELGPVERFASELDELCAKWIKKTPDDQLTYGEMVSSLEFKKWNLLQEAHEQGIREKSE